MNLEELNENIHKIFNIENIKYISSQDKITGIKFNLDQKNENFNHTIIKLLNLYIVPAFVLPSDQKNKDVSVRIGNRQETFIVKRYIKQDNAYIESTQLEQQKSSGRFFEKVKNFTQHFINGKEEIEFIEINKSNLNFQISSDKSTEVEITFSESEIDMQYIEGVLNCISNFKGLTNNDVIKPLIKINCNHPVAESQDKLNIYPFFSQRTIRDNKDNINQQETTLCLTTTQNDVTLVSSIFKNNAGPLKIKYKENKYSLLSYNLDNPFSQHLTNFLLFFNDPSCNGEAQISNLQRIKKIFSEDIEIKANQEDKEENGSNKAKIRIENATCSTSSLHYEGKNLQLKKSGSEEKIYFNFEVGVENDLDQKESKFIYDSMIYKIVSLISFFALSFNGNEFSISAEVDTKNIFSIKTNSYSELVPTICEKLKKHAISLDYTNPKPHHVQVLDLFCNEKKVKFTLEIEAQKIAINKLKDVEGLISSISILDSCRKEFLDNISNPSVYCHLSNFFYEGNSLSCIYVVTYPKNLSVKGGLLDENSAIDFLQNELQKNFDRISNNLKQIQKKENFSVYSIDINIDKLLSQHIDTLQEEATEVTEETKITEEAVKAEPQKYIEYDVDWQEECFAKITPTNDYTSLEDGLKEACKFVHYRVLHVCRQLLEKINTLQLGKEQKVAQDDQLSIDESTIQTTLDDNISNFNKFIDEKVREFEAIKLNLNVAQGSTIASIGNSTLNAVQRYKEVIKIHLFINKNANDLKKTLEKNVEALEQLIFDVQMSNICQMIAKISRSTEESKQSDPTTQQEESQNQDAELSNTENDNIGENEKVENEVTLEQILELFNKLNKKSIEWYNSEVESWLISTIDQGFGESKGEDDFDLSKSITTPEIDTSSPQIYNIWDEQVNRFLHQFESKIQKCINVKKQNFDEEQIKIITLDQYKQILNLADNIFYSAKILHYYKIQDGFEKLEKEIHNIVGITHDYLKKELDEQEEELKRREVQLKQEISVRKIGSDIIISATQRVVPLCKKVKDKIIDSIGQVQSQSSNVQNVEYSSSLFHNNHYNYNYQQSDFSQANTKYNSKIITNQSNSITIDSTCNHKRSNLQKLKTGIKDAFSEKENYAFLVFIAIATAVVLAYFVPEGLRKFVPSEKLNISDITVAVGATALIALSVAALAYSVYTNIIHSNMTDPTASSYTVHSLNS
ncbi:MAG: hypothetical protein sL5_07110 [Candidatus Mesenet longicola]|uniref:Uncharacterized protein n=1 Tax=Candidatus Mesenet longicola TaxID=1892558 RepID=A0A8J3MP67_9RICK|nr:MAG: hypothetical protein sGL2_07490 [Candidatus Mesenet longicola]GHM59718.1 MAG: hypothetical protein sL5_07110 [Candidatus Mesenet longicola]